MRFTVERNYLDVVGKIWMPNVIASLRINLSACDLENIAAEDAPTLRERCDLWLTKHSGDFSRVLDFSGPVGDEWVEWGTEEGEMAYIDTIEEPA